MSGLNQQELEAFLEELETTLKEEEKFLIDHGWTHKEGVIWVSPKGQEFSHDAELFGTHTRAIDKAKHDIVLDAGFIQFQVQIFNDEDEPKNARGSEEPYDWFFPCVKDGKIYFYLEAVDLACYNIKSEYNLDRWIALKTTLETLNVSEISSGDIIKVVEFFNFETKEYRFEAIK